MINSRQRAYLRSLANGLDTVMSLGKTGLTPEFTQSLDEVLETRELVKIGILKTCDEDARETADILAVRTKSEVVQIVGRKMTFYRKAKLKPKIELPK